MASRSSRLSFRASWSFAKVQVPLDEPPPPTVRRLAVPHLPPEIIEAIVRQVHDSATLKSCSLVSTTFLSPAQRFLFAKVAIHLKNQAVNPFTTFLDLITDKSKHLTVLITSLTLTDFAEGSETWFAYDNRVIPRILASVPNLTHLGVHSESREVSPRIQSALAEVYRRCALKSLSLRGMNVDLMEILRLCLSLRHLSLGDIDIPLDAEPDCASEPSPTQTLHTTGELVTFCATQELQASPTQSPTSSQLQANISMFALQLTRTMTPCVVETIIASPIWTSFARSLTILELDLIHFRHGPVLQRLLDTVGCSLHELRIRTFDVESLAFHLPPNITSVLFHFKMMPGLYKTNPSFVDIFQPFNRLHRHAHLAEVRLHIDTWTPHSLFDRPPWEWAFLDELLLCVRKVVWIVVTMFTPGEIMEEMKEALADRISECLPRSMGRRLLKVMVVA